MRYNNVVKLVPTFDEKVGTKGRNLSEEFRPSEDACKIKGFKHYDGWLTVKEGSDLEGISDRGFRKKLRSFPEDKLRQVSGNGGLQYEVHIDCLSDVAKARYLEVFRRDLAGSGMLPERSAEDLEAKDAAFMRRGEIANWQRDKACLRKVVVDAFLAYVGGDRGSIVERKVAFCRLYNSGLLDFCDEVRAVVRSVSVATLDRWVKALDAAGGDTFALAPQHGKNKGRHKVSEQEAALLRMAVLNPSMPVKESVRIAKEAMLARGLVPGASDATYVRYIEQFRANNFHVWTVMRDGEKALNDRVLPFVRRDREAVEVGDIVVADGHTFNFEILNPFTGRPCRMTLVLVFDFRSGMPLGWEIAVSENTRSIAMAYYRAIRALGFVPRVFYLDNGRAFRGKYFNKVNTFSSTDLPGLFDRLKEYGYMGTTFAWAYHGQSKTVERFFLELQKFEREQELFRGNSIEGKVPRLMRNEKLHQKWHERLTGGACPRVVDVHSRLVDWFKRFAETASGVGSALGGARPIDVFEESISRVRASADFADRCVGDDALRFLMMEHRTAAIYRNGIKLFGQEYWHESLFGLERGRRQYVIRYDIMDTSRVWVFEEDGRELICVAESNVFGGVHPMAGLLGSDQDVKRLSETIGLKRGLQHATVVAAEGVWRAQEEEIKRALPPVREVKRIEEAEVVEVKRAVGAEEDGLAERLRFADEWLLRDAEDRRLREAAEREKYRLW